MKAVVTERGQVTIPKRSGAAGYRSWNRPPELPSYCIARFLTLLASASTLPAYVSARSRR